MTTGGGTKATKRPPAAAAAAGAAEPVPRKRARTAAPAAPRAAPVVRTNTLVASASRVGSRSTSRSKSRTAKPTPAAPAPAVATAAPRRTLRAEAGGGGSITPRVAKGVGGNSRSGRGRRAGGGAGRSSDDTRPFHLTSDAAQALIREKLPLERRAEWNRAVGGDRWKREPRPVSRSDIEDEKRISARKQEVTGRRVPAVASSVGLKPFREGITMDFRRAVFLNFPTDPGHQMGAGNGVRWKNYLWKDESGKLIDNQCATGHHFSQIVQRGGLHDTWVGDVSGVADADGGSGLPAEDPQTQELMDEHVLSKLDGGCCVFEVHSDGATELMHQSLERLAEKGGTYQFTLPFGGFKIHAKVYFGIRTLGRRVTAVLFGTRHPCMMYMKLVAYPIIASKIMASAVAGSPRTPEQTESLLDMTGGTLSNEEWVEYYAGKLEALEPEERRAYDRS